MKTLAAILMLAAAPGFAAAQATKEDLKKLARAGISEDVILTYLRVNGFEGQLSTDDLVELKSAGIGDKVLAAVVEFGTEIPAEPEADPMTPEVESPTCGVPEQGDGVYTVTYDYPEYSYVYYPSYYVYPYYSYGFGFSFYWPWYSHCAPFYRSCGPYYRSSCPTVGFAVNSPTFNRTSSRVATRTFAPTGGKAVIASGRQSVSRSFAPSSPSNRVVRSIPSSGSRPVIRGSSSRGSSFRSSAPSGRSSGRSSYRPSSGSSRGSSYSGSRSGGSSRGGGRKR